jgi:hypothetical protein
MRITKINMTVEIQMSEDDLALLRRAQESCEYGDDLGIVIRQALSALWQKKSDEQSEEYIRLYNEKQQASRAEPPPIPMRKPAA